MKNTSLEIAKYALLPRIIPRIFALFGTGFSTTAYLIAVIYQTLGLLPANHPYLKAENYGRYGIRHVIAQASHNLVFSRQNIDQILIFGTVLLGLVLLLVQFILLGLALLAQPSLAFAQGAPALDLFNVLSVSSPFSPQTATLPDGSTGAIHPRQDLAFIILDRVFGTVGIFDSCMSPGRPNGPPVQECLNLQGSPIRVNAANVALPALPYPLPFHVALHSLLQFYTLGIYAVSAFILIYYVATITAETAISGTPFGQRTNKTWAPLRLILFFALLTPLNIGTANGGLNSAQLITLWTAKAGSNFATNAWGYFNSKLTCAYTPGGSCTAPSGVNYTSTGDPAEIIATPNVPEIQTLAQFIFTARACKIAEVAGHAKDIAISPLAGGRNGIKAYIVRREQTNPQVPGPNYEELNSINFDQARQFANYGTISIVFGTYQPITSPENALEEEAQRHKGRVIPQCGALEFEVLKSDPVPPATAGGAAPTGLVGAAAIQELYYNLVRNMWNDPNIEAHASCIVQRGLPELRDDNCTTLGDKDFTTEILSRFRATVAANLNTYIEQHMRNSEFDVNGHLASKGWAGASLWYNRIAEMNGNVSKVVSTLPTPTKYPYLMEYVRQTRLLSAEKDSLISSFQPRLPGDETISFERNGDANLADLIYQAYSVWGDDERYQGNVVIDMINAIFGTSGIFEMRRNADIHPLAQLSALGQSMLYASVRNIGAGLGGQFVFQASNTVPGEIGKSIASFLSTLGNTTFAMSFVLYYVLPFLPFIYFIFGVSGWIKSIFEAMVAMPLWALAHLRIDGEGLPGPAASNGYFLLLEIFLRPILILFGLLASIFIFSAMVKVLNNGVFDLVVGNLAGFDREGETDGSLISQLKNYRQPLDQFFFTALYVIIVYMIGLSCFKMVDLIPNTILRWAGSTVAAFQENAGDPAGQVTQKTYSGALLATNQVQGGALAVL